MKPDYLKRRRKAIRKGKMTLVGVKIKDWWWRHVTYPPHRRSEVLMVGFIRGEEAKREKNHET